MDNIKKFEDFLGRMQRLLDEAKKQGHIIVRVEDLENAFPELRESEDEKIRKELISLFQDGIDGVNHRYNGSDCKRWIVWLEKQGEQKQEANMQINPSEYINDMGGNGCYLKTTTQMPTDKVEPEFKVGDWVVNKYGDSWHIDSFDNKNYQVSDREGNHNYFSIANQDEMYLWTIQDAKDGDVLVGSYGTFIFMSKSDGYCGVLSDNTFIRSTGNNEWTEGLHPATKEQRALLFQKMKEAGYEWSDKDRKLIKKLKG